MILILAELEYQQGSSLNTEQIQPTRPMCLKSSAFCLKFYLVSDLERTDTSINLRAITSQQALRKQGDESQLCN